MLRSTTTACFSSQRIIWITFENLSESHKIIPDLRLWILAIALPRRSLGEGGSIFRRPNLSEIFESKAFRFTGLSCEKFRR